jgi:hypothetical protein
VEVTEPTGQFVMVGAQDVMVKMEVVRMVEMVEPAGMEVVEGDPVTVEVGATAEVEMMEDEAVPVG